MWTLFSAKPSQIRVCWYVLAGPHRPLILNPDLDVSQDIAQALGSLVLHSLLAFPTGLGSACCLTFYLGILSLHSTQGTGAPQPMN